MNIQQYKHHINKAFENAQKGISKCSPELLNMLGMTGKRTRHLYNNLVDMPDARYLEIGTWSGSSTCAAIYGNHPTYVYAVDNWSEFEGPKDIFFHNIKQFRGTTRIEFLETDFRKLQAEYLPKFNIYLYDGPHEFQDHVDALKVMKDCLDDVFIFIVDDWNWSKVRNATNQAIQTLGMKILHGIQIITTENDVHADGEMLHDYYWNGVCIFLLQKS